MMLLLLNAYDGMDSRLLDDSLAGSSLPALVAWARCAGFYGMIPPTMVVLERSLVLYVIDAGAAVTWFIPEEMSLRGISSI